MKRKESVQRAVVRSADRFEKSSRQAARPGAILTRYSRFLLLAVLPLAVWADDFVLIRGGSLPGKPEVRVEDFEMLDHPVTNAEYKLFVEAISRTPPLHWESGRIPPGMENHPVIFVNRPDVEAYLTWRSKNEGRPVRLPTATEFEYAARAGSADTLYPWGKEPDEAKANYDVKGERQLREWRQYLKPVKSYPPNPWKLYDMAGNVWQMVWSDIDYSTMRYIYRIAKPTDKDIFVEGGSWARTAFYLRLGYKGTFPSGIRQPDLGFRIVRAPESASHFRRQPRRMLAAQAGGARVYLGWQLLAGDSPTIGFHVYRSPRRDAAGVRVTREPVRGSSNFIDPQAPPGNRLYYRVRPVGADGKEGPPSEWAGITSGGGRSGLIAQFEPTVSSERDRPRDHGHSEQTFVFGDLDGDGVLDLLMRLDHGIKEDTRDPGAPIELEAYTSYGRALWRRPLVRYDKCFGNANNVPVAVYDLDGDGKAEIICRLQEGESVYLAILDGMTGEVRRKSPWTEMATDDAGTSTRIHLSVAYLNGQTPAIVTQTGLYENEIFDAFDSTLKKLWTFRSFAETSGSGSHHLDIADVDGDGKDEVFDGTTLLNPDGTVRWSIGRKHPDHVQVNRILPWAKDRQVFYAVETAMHAGVYVVDARSGKIVWKVNREDDPRWRHAHVGWASDVWEGSPGMEMLANRDGHDIKNTVLLSATGKILADNVAANWLPVNWAGGPVRELLSPDGKTLAKFNGTAVAPLEMPAPNEKNGWCPMVADLAGDYRDEVICVGATKEGNPAVFVFTNVDLNSKREITRTTSREYRLWMGRNITAGYPSYFEWQEDR